MPQLLNKPPDLDEQGNPVVVSKPPDLDESGNPISQPTDNKIGNNDGFGWLDKGLSAIHSISQALTPVDLRDNASPLPNIQGPELMKIPGIESAFKWLSDKIDNPQGVGGYGRGFAAGALQGLGNLLSTGADPRSVAPGNIIHQGQIMPEEPALPALKQLPPAPPPEPLRLNAAPRFIGGDAGIADINQPYRIDTSAVNPSMLGDKATGTVLPHELGELNPISPDLAARSGTTLGRPTNEGVVAQEFQDKMPSLKPLNQVSELPVLEGQVVDEPFQDTQFAKSKSGQGLKIGADIESLGKVLGSSLYHGDITKIATKELLQNSLDAVRPMGAVGKIDVEMNSKEHYIKVVDNGPGLTKQQLQTVFTDLGSSGKRSDVNAVGGFGLAKAAPLLGGKSVDVTSIAREKDGAIWAHTFSGTPDELIKGVNIKSVKLPYETPTGLQVKTHVPEDSSWYDAEEYVRELSENTSRDAEINLKRFTNYSKEPFDSKYPPKDLFGNADITTLNGPSSDIDIIVPKNAKYGESNGVEYKVLNNGMYQHAGRTGYNPLPGIPNNIIVNVKSKVPEGHADYPFTANREALRGSTQEQINKYIADVIVKPALGKRVGELHQVWAGMPEMDITPYQSPLTPDIKETEPRKFFIYDVGKKYSPQELNEIVANPTMQNLAEQISNITQHALEIQGNSKWAKRLERIGFIFDPELKGIHIPKPGGESSAILINPFTHFSGSRGIQPPDQASAGILHTILHELAHVEGGGHDEGFTIRLGNIYENYGALNALNAQKDLLNAISDPEYPEDYNESISDLLYQYSQSRGRETTYNDPLKGTGIGSKSDSTGKPKIPDDSQSSPEESITRLFSAINDARPIREAQEESYSAERGARIKEADKVKTKGAKGFFKKLGKLKGSLEKVDYQPIKLSQTDIDNLFDTINSSNLRGYEKITAGTALGKVVGIYGNGEVPQHGELDKLERVFGNNIGQKIIEMHGGLGALKPPPGAARYLMNETANFVKAQMASTDISFPLRQGLPMIYRPEWWQAWGPMFAQMKDQTVFKAAQEAIFSDPAYGLAKKGGLKLTDPGERLVKGEEIFKSDLAAKLPWVRISEQGYIGFANKLRFDVFKNMLKEARKAGKATYNINRDGEAIPTELTKQISAYINNRTGVGSLDFSFKGSQIGNLEKIAPEMNYVIWSPRLIASKIRRFGGYESPLNPKFYTQLDPMLRKEALKSLFAVASFIGLANGVGMIFGGKSNPDVTSSDFGKSTFGNTRWDMGGGDLQYIVAASRMISAAYKAYNGDKPEFGKTMWDVANNFRRSKDSPLIGFAEDLMHQKDPVGRPFNPGKEIEQMFIPMVINDAISVWQEDPSLMPLIPSAVAGGGVQVQLPNQQGLKPLQPMNQKVLKPLVAR